MNNLKLKEPFVAILIGPPLSGKSTYVKNNFDENCIVISRDQIVLDLSDGMDYNDAFKSVSQKEVDRELTRQLTEAGESNMNVIVDMTHMGSKRRKQNLDFFPDHYKVAIIFPILEDEEYERRNKLRNQIEGKYIPTHVIKGMINSYQPIQDNEGFDRVISI